jgi:hypothetical protein
LFAQDDKEVLTDRVAIYSGVAGLSFSTKRDCKTPFIFFGLPVMTQSYAPLRHDIVFPQEHLALGGI